VRYADAGLKVLLVTSQRDSATICFIRCNAGTEGHGHHLVAKGSIRNGSTPKASSATSGSGIDHGDDQPGCSDPEPCFDGKGDSGHGGELQASVALAPQRGVDSIGCEARRQGKPTRTPQSNSTGYVPDSAG
jgi:hypothetical protein